MNTNKIIVVGGGSAGWMTAATLIKAYPEKDITLIESPQVPTVGVGESTVGGIKNWTTFLGIDDKEFLEATDGSYKLSIKFTDFYKKGEAFHYPFGDVYTDHPNDWWFKKIARPDTPYSNYSECMYPQMALVNQNKLGYNEDNDIPFEFHKDTAYHFDATKFALWLKDNYCLPRGVKHVQEKIEDIEYDEDGICSLNGKYMADLFIDCTGFASILMGKTLKEPFEDASDLLPNDSAWATRMPYIDKKSELVPYTNCTAIDNGWVWNIPLWSRVGTGYVYSSKFISDQEALEEFKNYLGPRSKGLEFKKIKMRQGIHSRLWVKNVCTIGLSAGFIEPLESNGLWTTHEFLMKLVHALRKGAVSQWDKDNYTFVCKRVFRNFLEFVKLHYALSSREDTPYWKSNANQNWCPSLLNFEQENMNGLKAYADNISKYNNVTDGGAHCIGAGMHNSTATLHSLMYHQHKSESKILEECEASVSKVDLRSKKWYKEVEHYESLHDFLLRNIYTNP
jgi:tryptophan halogenase